MIKDNSEEKAPLLYVVDDGLPKDYRYFDTGRFSGISSGATAVFTHFPDYIGTCCVVTAVSALIFFMMMLLVLSTLTVASLRLPRCATAQEIANDTIHLVHIHNPNYQEIEKLNFVQELVKLYPTYNIRILTLPGKEEIQNKIIPGTIEKESIEENSNAQNEITSSIAASTQKQSNILQRMKDIKDTQLLLNMLMRGMFMDIKTTESTTAQSTTDKAIKNVEDLGGIYPKISYENISYNETFFGTPLQTSYKYINEKLQIFAVRVLQIWQYGGLSFDLQNADKADLKHLISKESTHHHDFEITEKDSRNVWVNTVSVDDQAFHLESKIPCHVFFEQILMILRGADQFTTVQDVMKKAIRSFCLHYPVNRENCIKYMTV
ncbi:uncharacterized protein LOC114329294 isoform X2 [Diabrotica virgifera virgifera]|nr:uncharacterized protein LOC114329294 isoform X2 [Diabrotica virgifera virgifera]